MKEKLRVELKKIRNSLSQREVHRKSNKIKKKLLEMDEFKQAHYIAFYVSYNNEVHTHDMIKDSLAAGKQVVVPISNKKNKCLLLSKLERWNELEVGAYGILEPMKQHVKEISIGIIDIVIVPGIAFDEYGHRIGHGMGYYDDLLKTSLNAVHIGLAFEFQIVDTIPVEEQDVPVDKIVTEKRIIERYKEY